VKSRRGLSLVELLVVMAILGVLFSILFVVIQAVRESARRFECQHRMRQISLAVASYESSYRCFPQANNDHGGFLSTILPFNEKDLIYREVVTFVASGEDWAKFSRKIPEYICPSDSAAALVTSGASGAGSNYSGNSGSWIGSTRKFDGIFSPLYDFGFGGGIVKARDVTDGMSTTNCLSECLRANGNYHRLRVNWNLPILYHERRVFADACNSVPSNAHADGWEGNRSSRGYPWISGNLTVTLHNHIGTPNSPSCYNKSMIPTAMSTATSLHQGGVNAAMADGSIGFVSEAIDSDIWFARGSRNGNGMSPTEN